MQPRTRTATFARRGAPAAALQYLYGDKIPTGDFLALLCGNNEFM